VTICIGNTSESYETIQGNYKVSRILRRKIEERKKRCDSKEKVEYAMINKRRDE